MREGDGCMRHAEQKTRERQLHAGEIKEGVRDREH